MTMGVLADIIVTILIYRWLFAGQAIFPKPRKEQAKEFALRVGLAWVFPLIAIWLTYALGFEGVAGLFGKKEVS